MNTAAKYFLICLPLATTAVPAAPPQLYRQPAYESPVRAEPDDLLLLPGYGLAPDDMVIYRAVSDTTLVPPTPMTVPARSTSDLGLADIVSSAQVPYSLTVKLPRSLRMDQSYALWVRTARGEWSKPLLINDARPLWISPAYAFESASIAALPREIKIVGRNLQASSDRSTQVRLTGPQVYFATALSDERSSPTLNHYVARIALPPHLRPGRYQVALSRDQTGWVQLPDQQLEVLADPPMQQDFSIADPQFGNCKPDDGLDDTSCIVGAIAAAATFGGGTVYFPPGTWDLIRPAYTGVAESSGILVPAHVQLRGAGRDRTRLVRHQEWNQRAEAATFTLTDHSRVSGFTFRDLKTYTPDDRAGSFLQLGEDYARVAASLRPGAPPPQVTDVTITQNQFDRVYIAIGSAGLPIRRLFITYNTFGAYYSALELGGNPFNMTYKYRIDDTVIDNNIFRPGSRMDLRNSTGTMASEIGAGHRLDFSGNSADGTSTEYLYDLEDPRGWRAAFFWNLNGNFEEMLVSQNEASCTGDKIGDGEAIAYDNNDNTFAFALAPTTLSASSSSVAVSASLVARQNNRDINVASYYIGHWVQIVSGPGLGQARRITGYDTDPVSHQTTFRVTPDWDVVPVAGMTRISIGREFWQTYTLDNLIDHRRPPCQKSNRTRHNAGVITMYAQSADSVVEGNLQHDTAGILIEEGYIVPDHPCANCTLGSFVQSFLEVRANTIDGEYDWDTDCSDSGIVTAIAISPIGDPLPPTVGYGVSIAHNKIRHADATRGGAIALTDPWFAGPEPHRWPSSDNELIYHNDIRDISGPRAFPLCGGSVPRIGINFPRTNIAWRTVLYSNSCRGVGVPLATGGKDNVRVCPSSAENTCECSTKN